MKSDKIRILHRNCRNSFFSISPLLSLIHLSREIDYFICVLNNNNDNDYGSNNNEILNRLNYWECLACYFYISLSQFTMQRYEDKGVLAYIILSGTGNSFEIFLTAE